MIVPRSPSRGGRDSGGVVTVVVTVRQYRSFSLAMEPRTAARELVLLTLDGLSYVFLSATWMCLHLLLILPRLACVNRRRTVRATVRLAALIYAAAP